MTVQNWKFAREASLDPYMLEEDFRGQTFETMEEQKINGEYRTKDV
jgi:hypothetical protein